MPQGAAWENLFPRPERHAAKIPEELRRIADGVSAPPMSETRKMKNTT